MVLLDMGIYVFCLLFFKVFILKSLVWEYFWLILCLDFYLGFFFLCGNGGGGGLWLCRIYKVIIIFKRKMGDWWYIVDVEIILYNKFDN